jgi:hypothetical protein
VAEDFAVENVSSKRMENQSATCESDGSTSVDTVRYDDDSLCWRVPVPPSNWAGGTIEDYYDERPWKSKFAELEQKLREADDFMDIWVELRSAECEVFWSGPQGLAEAVVAPMVEFCREHARAPKRVQLFPAVDVAPDDGIPVASVEGEFVRLYYWVRLEPDDPGIYVGAITP